MTAWQILTLSIAQVFGNLRAALRISALLFAVQVIVGLAIGIALGRQFQVAGQGGSTELVAAQALFGKSALAILVSTFAYLWVAVAWHRFALRREESPSLIPLFEGGRLLGYFGMAALILTVSVVALTFAITLIGLVVSALPPAVRPSIATVVPLLAIFALFAPVFRLSTVLPGIALKAGHRVGEGWDATRGTTATLYALGFMLTAVLILVQIVLSYLDAVLPYVALVLGIGVQWVQMMVGISILTTLYSHYVVKRPPA